MLKTQTSNNTTAISQTNQKVANLDTRLTTDEGRISALEQTGVSQATQNKINSIDDKANRALEGVAISLSVADPVLRGNEVFGMRVNWGNYSGQNAFGASVIGVIDQNVFGNGEKLAISGGLGIGFGSGEGHVGGRVGAQLTW